MAEGQLGTKINQGNPKDYTKGSTVFRRGSVDPFVSQIKDLLLKFFNNLKDSKGQNLEIPKEILALKPSQEAISKNPGDKKAILLYQTFGPTTELAVKTFQSWYRNNVNPQLLIDGKVREQTWSALNSTFTDDIVPIPPPPLKKITGTIRDFDTDQPLSGVIVKFNPDPNNQRQSITDSNGFFSLDLTEDVVFYAGIPPTEDKYKSIPTTNVPSSVLTPPVPFIYPTTEYLKYTNSYKKVLNDPGYLALDPTLKKEILQHLKIVFDKQKTVTIKEKGKNVNKSINYVYKGAKTLTKDRLNYITPLTAEGEWIYDLKTIYLFAPSLPNSLDVIKSKQMSDEERKKITLKKPDVGILEKALNQTLSIVRERLNDYVVKQLDTVGISDPYLVIDALNEFDTSIKLSEEKDKKYKASLETNSNSIKTKISSSFSEFKSLKFPNPFTQNKTEKEETSADSSLPKQTATYIDPFDNISRVTTIDDVEIPVETPLTGSTSLSQITEDQSNQSDLGRKLQILIARGILIIPKKCPADAQGLTALIENRNKVTAQLNTINNVLSFNLTSVKFINVLLENFQVAKIAALAAYATIPAPAALVTTGIISAQEDTKNELLKNLDKQIDKLRAKIEPSEKMILSILLELNKILIFLSLLDVILKECATDQNLPLDQVSEDIIKATAEATSQGQSVSTFYKGFTLEIQTEESDSEYKRRFAQARDSFGVIVLKGQPSFSSNPQILLNELKFQIDSKGLGEPPAVEILNPLPRKQTLPSKPASNIPPPLSKGEPTPVGYVGKFKGEKAYIPVGNGSTEDVYEWTGNSWTRTGEINQI